MKKKLIKIPTFSLFLLISFMFFSFYNPVNDYEFINFTMKDGLESLVVYSIYQDLDGFLWFGGEGGLTRYDGYYFKSFKNDPLNLESISSNNISSIFVNKSNKIWVGTWGGGLNFFDPLTSKFTIFKNDPQNENSISGNRIQVVFEDSKKRVWAGTYKKGLNLYNEGKFYHYFINEPSKRIWTISEDSSGKIWAGTSYGLYYYDEKNDKFNQTLLKNITVRKLLADDEGILWIGTEKGIFIYDTITKKLTYLSNLPEVPVNAIVKCENIVWIGTYGAGLIRLNKQTFKYTIIRSGQKSTSWLTHDDVRALFLDKSMNLWIGTRGGGLFKLNLKPSNFYSFNLLNYKKLKDNKVLSFEEIQPGLILIGTNKGVSYFDLFNKNFYEVNNIHAKEISSGKIRALFKESNDMLWVSVKDKGIFKLKIKNINSDKKRGIEFLVINIYSKENNNIGSDVINRLSKENDKLFACSDNGLYIYNKKKDIFEHAIYNGKGIITSQVVNSIDEISSNEYLIATESGLLKIKFKNKYSNEVISIVNFSKDRSIRISNFLNLTHSKYNKNIIWIGSENGILKYNIKSDTITILKDPALYNVYISGIVEMGIGDLWVATKYGILKYSVYNGKIKTYYNLKGVLKEYLNNSFYITGENNIFFGSLNGFTTFNPDKSITYSVSPSLAIISIKINDKEILNNKNIKSLPKIIVPPKRNKIYIEFTCLDLTFPEKNNYYYKLEGYDSKWHNNGNRNYVIFTNLDGGSYKLKLRASNYNGILTKNDINIHFFVKTPFYLQWWAFTLYFFLLVFIINIIVKIKTRFNEIEIEKQKMLIKELKELDKIKDEFFNNITYEIELPVRKTIMLLKSILDKKDTVQNKNINETFQSLLLLNVQLSRVINEILLYSRLKSNDLRFEFQKIKLFELVERIIYILSFYLKDKKVKIINNIDISISEVVGDWIKLEEVFFNLIKMIISFIDKGEIVIENKLYNKKVLVKIKCNNCLIPKEIIKFMMNPDLSYSSKSSYKYSDVELNLSISKKIIENHNGKIHIKSKQNKSFSIYFDLPAYKTNIKYSNIKTGNNRSDNKNGKKYTYDFGNIIYNYETELIKNKDIKRNIRYKNQYFKDEKIINIKNKKNHTIVVCDNDLATINTFINYCTSKNLNYIVYKKTDDLISALNKVDIKIDLLIINTYLEGKKSFDFINYIRSKYNFYELPVIAIVERTEILDLEFLLGLGINDVIFKPIIYEDFKFKIKTFLKLKEEIDKNEILKENIDFKNYLIKIIGHDLRNPLSVILIAVSELKNNIKNELYKKYIDFIQKSTLQIQDVLNNFFEYAKLSSRKIQLNFRENEIIKLIEMSIQDFSIFAKEKKQEIIFNTEYKSFKFRFDKFLLKRVIDNLLSNAIKYSQIGSKIFLNVKTVVKDNKKYFYFEVISGGKNIPDNEFHLLFKPFQKLTPTPTKNESSTGLGLAISKSIIDLHKGEIGYKKSEGNFNIFYIKLPIEGITDKK